MLKYIIYLIYITIFVRQNLAELHTGGILYPRVSETRQLLSLDGIWNFAVPHEKSPLQGHDEQWFKNDLTKLEGIKVQFMPVPSSYNDITTDENLRDHVGFVWYDRRFFVPNSWQDQRVWLRFGSVSYAAQVWVNGELVMKHEIGHLPFVAEISQYLKFNQDNLLTVACDNTLLHDTIPQGQIQELPTGRLVQTFRFDFFNYAGIDRSVHLYTTPLTYIDDITLSTAVTRNNGGILAYKLSCIISTYLYNNVSFTISLLDKHNNVVSYNELLAEPSGIIEVQNVHLWWPYLMHEDPGYLYTFKVEIVDSSKNLLDSYSLRVGFRTITWTNSSLLMNFQPLYLHGFGRHEDSDFRGKGLDLPLIIKDHNLIKWIGANTYRTSHYPYAEEIMDIADQLGIMVIDECPSVNTDIFSQSLLEKHKTSLTELIRRDKNRPAVIMWSAANEPSTSKKEATEYFKRIIGHIKQLDQTRPTTIVESANVNSVYSSNYVDIVSFNEYQGWYANSGFLDVIPGNVVKSLTAWHKKFQKPVIMQEYGADTLEGLHILPAFIWSEEYQVELMSKHFEAFDKLRAKGWFIGEFIWNFADFKTGQTYTRVGGNKKGVFTRNRQPKASAYHLRRRYWALANQLYNATLPNDLYDYIITKNLVHHDEL